jgi:acetyl-CoA carboxylase biotin carboxylase subunit
MFEKVLIANRGEIAIRVMRTCKEMGIKPIAVYSDVDRVAFHVAHAYEAHHIGASESRESYLNIERIIDAVKKSGAEAVHPGYGFLAENADFARACAEAGVAFIGPPPEAIEAMGNKLRARDIMKAAGVPMVPGSDGAVDDPDEARKVAADIGYPVLIKAAAGGGGKGMRIVREAGEFASALDRTMSEAKNAFGDPAVYVEKYIDSPKHIEIQIMADGHGRVVTFGERECSMQRRYQKVIEEAPSPVVTPEMRRDLSDAARRAAEAVGYRSAGTVEFIADAERNFYFLEMNTRLQVEHPVTELVYGVDLVRMQLEIAAGAPLDVPGTNGDVLEPRGHAVEMRIYAEDPANHFMPHAGTVQRLELPEGPGVRNDNGVYPGAEVPLFYDPMIGKLSVWAENREDAIARAHRSLKEYRCEGVRTNVEFLLWALAEPGFRDGSYDTHYIENHFSPDKMHKRERDVELAAIAASIAAFRHANTVQYRSNDQGSGNGWRSHARRAGLRKPIW